MSKNNEKIEFTNIRTFGIDDGWNKIIFHFFLYDPPSLTK